MSIFLMNISLRATYSPKWCSFILRYLVRGMYSWFVEISSASLLSLKTLHLIVGATLFTGKIYCFVSCSNYMRSMTSLSVCQSHLYSDSVDDRPISICSSDFQLTGNPLYITIHLCLGLAISQLCVS